MTDFKSIKKNYDVKRNTDKNKLVNVLKTTHLANQLPNEVLNIIAEFVYPDELHIVFQRIDITTLPLSITKKYIVFSGSTFKLERSLKQKDIDVYVDAITCIVYDTKVLYDQRCEQIINSRNWSRSGVDTYEIIRL